MVQFPLVRWSVIVCSHDDIGTQAHASLRNQNMKLARSRWDGLTVTWRRQCELLLLFSERTPTLSRCHDVPMKGNNMTNQKQPGQQNQAPDQKPGQQQGGGSKPGQQSQAPGKGDRNPKEQLDQTSDTDT
ncbi:hypothetical protein [Bradyrhizobium sp.]|jgi:hypothetical protein|uniref:hypothetical protein n=1 Tax=Bradyrhizobium sp. TaxID=376 RepID=UPI003C79E77C